MPAYECRVGSLQVFISYRRLDAQSASRQLAESLKQRFGAGEVFFDTLDIATGNEWRRDTVARVKAADVVLAVIGPRWVAAADDHARRTVLARHDEDLVRLEIETAFAHGAIVIPVLVDEATMPTRDALPRPFRPLADVHAQTLHHTTWDRDVETLAEALEHLATRARPWEPPREAPAPVPRNGRTEAERVACYVAERSVVTVLGCGANAVDRDVPWEHGSGALPDGAELARHLARRFEVAPEDDDLARVSQRVSLTEGRVDLHRTLRELLVKPECAPTSVHRFAARIPGRLRELGRESYQLIVTTNYDTALERAFDDAKEPYDLVVFMATGVHRGRFVHVKWWDPHGRGCKPIMVPNEYVELPIDEEGEAERTVILKLHGGAADLGSEWPGQRDNFVVTEDDYIGYLTQSPVGGLIPLQILNKLRDSHFLFLGYRVRDWSLRVFLQRIWGEQPLEARSWAVDPAFDVFERELWEHLGVNVVEERAASFLGEVDRCLGAFGRERVKG